MQAIILSLSEQEELCKVLDRTISSKDIAEYLISEEEVERIPPQYSMTNWHDAERQFYRGFKPGTEDEKMALRMYIAFMENLEHIGAMTVAMDSVHERKDLREEKILFVKKSASILFPQN